MLWVAFIKRINHRIINLSFFYLIVKLEILREIIKKKENKN